jgi:hypothetical protein
MLLNYKDWAIINSKRQQERRNGAERQIIKIACFSKNKSIRSYLSGF